MGFSDLEGFCRNHPNQRQAPGVCSSCLRERLSTVVKNRVCPNESVAESESFNSSPPYSSSSPPRYYQQVFSIRHARNASDGVGLFSMPLEVGFDDKSGLRKSRSVAVVPMQRRVVGDAAAGGGGKKKSEKGFWKKLLLSTGKRTKEVLRNPIAVGRGGKV